MSGARRVVVSGRVQGVGFRWFVRDAAARLGLVGWVANRADGTVVAEASGSEEALDALVEALRRGPPGANVADISAATIPLPSDAETWRHFEIRT